MRQYGRILAVAAVPWTCSPQSTMAADSPKVQTPAFIVKPAPATSRVQRDSTPAIDAAKAIAWGTAAGTATSLMANAIAQVGVAAKSSLVTRAAQSLTSIVGSTVAVASAVLGMAQGKNPGTQVAIAVAQLGLVGLSAAIAATGPVGVAAVAATVATLSLSFALGLASAVAR